MGMSISGVGNAWSSQASSGVGASRFQQRQQSFQALFSALKAGNLGAAQQAYTGLSGSKSLAAATSAARTASADGASALAQLGQALQASNLGLAQQIAQQMQSGQGVHGAGSQAAGVASGTTATTGTLLNVSA